MTKNYLLDLAGLNVWAMYKKAMEEKNVEARKFVAIGRRDYHYM